MEPQSSTELTKQAIALKKAGDTSGAISLLVQALNTTPNFEAAWLWLAACLTVPAEQRYCLEQALSANPESQPARNSLVRFDHVRSMRPTIFGVEAIEAPFDIAPAATVASTQSGQRISRVTLSIIACVLVVLTLFGMSNASSIVSTPNQSYDVGPGSDAPARVYASDAGTQTPIPMPSDSPTTAPAHVPTSTAVIPSITPSTTPTAIATAIVQAEPSDTPNPAAAKQAGSIHLTATPIGFMASPTPTKNASTAVPWPTTKPIVTIPSTSGGTRTGAICQDGSTSSATGRGACSHHGGVSRWTH